MTFLNLRFYLYIIVAAFMGSFIGYWRGHVEGVNVTTAAAQKAQLAAVHAARTEEQRRTAAQQEVADNAAQERDQARADAAAAASAADGLRQQVAVLVEHARHSAAAAGSAPAGDPIGVLADVLGSIDDRAGELAKIADERGIAGQQCERDYDALTAAK